MSSPNFGSVLDKPSDEIKRPPALPGGHYIFVLKGLPRQDKSSKKQTEFVEFTAFPVQAQDDVDEEEMKAFVDAFGSIQEKVQKLTFYLTENSVFRLKEFMFDDLKIEDDGGPLRPKLEQTIGCQFLGHVVQTPSDDGKGMYANIKTTAPIED